jgi:Fe-S-cluster containining protein
MTEYKQETLACRPGCGACCIAPSISSPLPGMPQGKPAGVRCPQLTEDNRCKVHGLRERPAVCASFPVSVEHCSSGREEALLLLAEMERLTGSGPGREGSA